MGIEIKLEAFEGPLDLLLHLIARAKVSIEDIFVSEVTEQFIEYVQQMQEMDLDVASEFISMAATLLRIKSRSLLPNEKPEEEDVEEQQIKEQLRDYARIRAILGLLSEMESEANTHYYKLREEFAFQSDPIDMTGIGLNTLFSAMQAFLDQRQDKLSEERINVVRREPVSVRSRIDLILRHLSHDGRVRFSELFRADSSKEEIIATFLALLELITEGRAAVSQKERFSEIEIEKGLRDGEDLAGILQ